MSCEQNTVWNEAQEEILEDTTSLEEKLEDLDEVSAEDIAVVAEARYDTARENQIISDIELSHIKGATDENI